MSEQSSTHWSSQVATVLIAGLLVVGATGHLGVYQGFSSLRTQYHKAAVTL
jgi:hypothetical protein